MKFRVGRVIAHGETLLHPNPRRRNVSVAIGRPIEVSSGEWRCRYQILGIGDDEVLESYGVTSLQALVLSVEVIGIRLRTVEGDFSLRSVGAALLTVADAAPSAKRRSKTARRVR